MTTRITSSTWNPGGVKCSVDGCQNVAHVPVVLSPEMAAIKGMPQNLSRCLTHTEPMLDTESYSSRDRAVWIANGFR